jgi:1,4-alpha-glucan branching enzyme
VADLNALYKQLPALHVHDFDSRGFAWLPLAHHEPTILAWLRRAGDGDAFAVVICNLTTQPRHGLHLGLPAAGAWHELLNSDAACYGGSGVGNLGRIEALPVPLHGMPASAGITVPPLATLVLSNRPHPSSSSEGASHARQ